MTKVLINPGSSGEYGWHGCQTLLLCPRKYALDKAEHIKVESPATVKGTLLHVGLAHHYAILQNTGTDYYSPIEAMRVVAEQGDNQVYADCLETTEAALAAYIRHYNPEPWVPLDIEHVVKVKVDDYPYTQRVDLTVTHRGKVYFVDHKTTFRLSGTTAQRYNLSGQMLGYSVIGKKMYGERWGGVILNLIGWDGGFKRVPVEDAPGAEASFRATVLWANKIRRMFEGQPAADWPAAFHEHACMTQYGPCAHRAWCQYGC